MNEANACKPRETATADQEYWVQERILTAIRMAVELRRLRKVGADEFTYEYGLRGIAEGTAREIISTLNIEPAYENIRKLSFEMSGMLQPHK